ncbi:hypothetical protein [Pseudoroseomonas cervicalis]|uniref:hypothetical protein n=1 Tax=Teichococcus cervicalis TaxID=204525 RepID=UPI0027D7E6AB|nr:hypothetical protein [Pseudoroseomonas cervicalis]
MALAQGGFTPWAQPDGSVLTGSVLNCVTTGRTAVPCGTNSTPLRVSPASGAAAQPVSGSVAVTNLPATQPVSGTVSVSNLPVTQPVSGSVSVSNLPATQQVGGTVSVGNFPAAAAPLPNRGVATACTGAGSIGTTSTAVCAAGTGRLYLALQNQSDTAVIYCNLMGGAATAGPPSRKLMPNASLVQGHSGGGFVTTAAINCIATAAATPLSAEVVQ